MLSLSSPWPRHPSPSLLPPLSGELLSPVGKEPSGYTRDRPRGATDSEVPVFTLRTQTPVPCTPTCSDPAFRGHQDKWRVSMLGKMMTPWRPFLPGDTRGTWPFQQGTPVGIFSDSTPYIGTQLPFHTSVYCFTVICL